MSWFATERLPAWLAPRAEDSPKRRLWRVETIALIIVGLVLAVAAINDVFYSVHASARLVADQNTWRHYTHRDYFNVSAGPLVVGMSEDLSCANATPAPPGERTQICILLDGPVVNGLRSVVGGWRLPARTGDFPAARYDCYGAGAAKALCPKG
ncbi:MAG TPA: hypothetical protein VHM72_02660 [Solirubrobacteraceae bacterium]|nr:hypothetical protein [Solirubrobacteraceae bacterium]